MHDLVASVDACIRTALFPSQLTQVRNIRTKVDNSHASASAAAESAAKDAQLFLAQAQEENCFLRFTLDEDKRLSCVAWAHEQQVLNATRYHSVVILDTMFKIIRQVSCEVSTRTAFYDRG